MKPFGLLTGSFYTFILAILVPTPRLKRLLLLIIILYHMYDYNCTGLLRALFFGEKCATCVQFMECAGVRSICCVSIKYEFLFDKSRQISINIM